MSIAFALGPYRSLGTWIATALWQPQIIITIDNLFHLLAFNPIKIGPDLSVI